MAKPRRIFSPLFTRQAPIKISLIGRIKSKQHLAFNAKPLIFLHLKSRANKPTPDKSRGGEGRQRRANSGFLRK